MVGASGAIYGILVAFALIFPNSELFILFLPFPIKAKFLVPILILGDIFFGFSSYSVGPIAHFAHIGGALTGFLRLCLALLNKASFSRLLDKGYIIKVNRSKIL